MYEISGDGVLIVRTITTQTQTLIVKEYYCPLRKTVNGVGYIFDLASGEYVEV